MPEGGGLSAGIKQIFWQRFVNVCHQAVVDGYRSMLDLPYDYCTWKEGNISARLKHEMEQLSLVNKARISIDIEDYLDDEGILTGKKDAQKADRIDFRFSTWSQEENVKYFGEAKNLSERNWYKNPISRKGKVNANYYSTRYIETGIQRVVSGKYSHLSAFLIGYVMNGHTPEIVTTLNQMIQDQGLLPEIGLIENQRAISGYPNCFTSNNSDNEVSKSLVHIFLDFAPMSE